MITGEMKNKVDSIWDTIWTGGITSPITVLEQITYLMFMKLLDDINKRGTTIVMATHARDIVDAMQKRVVTLHKGHIIRDIEKGGYSDEA